MKKIYSLLAVVAFAMASAQGTESFDKFPVTTAVATSGSYVGDMGITINYYQSAYASLYPITGKGLMLADATKQSYVEFVIPAGMDEFTFQYRKGMTAAADRQVFIYVNGEYQDKTDIFGNTSGKDETIYTKTVKVDKSGEVKIKLKHPDGITKGVRQIIIDNVSWTKYKTQAVANTTTKTITLVKNTLVTDKVEFGVKAEVKIYSLNGQLVKSASVNEGTSLDVTHLSNGVYIVTAVVEGQSVSQKIIKK